MFSHAALNATLNATSAILLAAGYIAIRTGKRDLIPVIPTGVARHFLPRDLCAPGHAVEGSWHDFINATTR